MTTASSTIPLTGVPFPAAEYESRQQKVLEAMARAGLDALVVTAHGHLQYLTGYPGFGGYFAPFPFIITPGRKPTFVVREYEIDSVRADSCIDEIVGYTQQGDFGKVCADVLRQYGVQGRRVGFELGCWNIAPADVSAVQAHLPELKIVDATHLVASVAAVKSELELEAIREAATMTDLAVRTWQDSLREGVTEAEVHEKMEEEAKKAGGELRTRSLNLMFGDRTKLPHGFPKANPLNNNEPAMVELGGVKCGYAAPLVRGAVLGRHPEIESLHNLSVDALEAAIAVIKPGVTAGEVDEAGRRVLERAGRSSALRHRAGYQTGINWTERGNISLEPGAKDVLESGMTLHLPYILYGESGYLFGTSEHVLVTDTGTELLSGTPHTLYQA